MIEILTSGVALGVHVPGLLLADRLRERGVDATVSVLEALLPEDKLRTTAGMKVAFHRDFRLARVGQRVASDPVAAADPAAVSALLERWRALPVRRFVVFSGFWLRLVERYLSTCAVRPRVDVCHVDSVLSPSFRRAPDVGARPVWLAHADSGRLPCSIPVTRTPPLPWRDRAERLLLHGGGWGMGTYREEVGGLRAHGFELDVVAYELADVSDVDSGVRYHMMDPDWHPWHDVGYPPFGEVKPGAVPEFRRGMGHHGSFDLCRRALAMVSKPGGGTLLDSLWSATPVVFLDPFGDHERRNAELWCGLGFGVGFADWKASGFDVGPLGAAHEALLAARDVPDYSRLLAEAS
ncbi:hypothetical protein [Umezawaea tangerina]|uniref:UDP-N-acetylglucosamine:LPS N-acetylglucosamine transferase n=1 Tax=Umezawaea tangerina TaxID=84725 RepID=A0A2T0STE2_9PSEU|nr:hypothetical protein [Umezawaea tangerina]PRY36679.1 hypothetical protein CLV43_11151 [Umezawaea tangerina]